MVPSHTRRLSSALLARLDDAGQRLRALSVPVERRLPALLLGVVGGGGVIIATSLVLVVRDQQPPEGWRLLLAAALAMIGNTPLLRVRFGSQGSSFNYGEAAVVVLLPLLPSAWLFLVSTAAVALTQVIGRIQPRKAIFNVCCFTLSIAAAALVVHLIAPIPPNGQLTARQVVGLVLGMVLFAVLENAAVAAAVAFSQDLSFGFVVRRALGINLLVAAVNLTIGINVLILGRWDWRTLLPLPAFVVTVLGTYRGYLLAVDSRDTWQRLELAGKDLNQLDEAALVEAVLHHAGRIFLADWAELALDGGGGLSQRRYRAYLTQAGAGVAARFDKSGRAEAGVHVETSAGSSSSATVVALRERDQQLGWLRIGFKGPVKLSEREMRVLANFGRTVSAAVANARLYAELRLEAERKEFEANHDVLTGLANRRMLLGAFAEAAGRLPARRVCALLLVDLDHFKEINDTLGHTVGDALLCRLADRLTDVVGSRGTVARPGGDEFAVLLPAVRETDVEYVADQLQRSLAEPVIIEHVRLSIEATIGAACLPSDGTEPGELLQRADVALSRAKATTATYARYQAAYDSTSVERLELAAQLRAALSRDELVVHYQPQVDLTTGRIVGVEALTRWQHPERGLLPPAEFIPVVEQSGLIRAFTLHVLGKAAAQAAAWARAGVAPHVSVNLAARSLLDRQLPEDVAHILRRHGVPASWIVLEITETTMMTELDVVEDVLAGLRALGVELSVDDFGTGYSSLVLLQRIAVNEIKVDKSFVLRMLASDSDQAIVRATVELGHSLGLRVVAEGVEDIGQLAALRRLGCDRAQGFHVGHPVPADALRTVDLSWPPVRLAALHGAAVVPQYQAPGH